MARSFIISLISTGFYLLLSGSSLKQPGRINEPEYQSEQLSIRKISGHVYLHTSFLQTGSFGKVPCNGIVVVNERKAVVFDTPADNGSAEELIAFFKTRKKVAITAIVATHFHADCVGGLKAFHDHNIKSYAGRRTIDLLKAKEPGFTRPKNIFADSLSLKIGSEKVYAGFFGAGHTTDNAVGYFAIDRVLFGGCLVKEAGAQKGNLDDADVKAWPITIRKLKDRFPEAKVIIPGHGKPGGPELLDYTISLFEQQ